MGRRRAARARIDRSHERASARTLAFGRGCRSGTGTWTPRRESIGPSGRTTTGGSIVSRRVGVIGAGAWGTALAQVAARSGHDVILWARQRAVADAINATRQNRSRLENVPLEAAISATSDAADLAGCDLILIATPAQAMREVLAGFGGHLRSGMPAVIAAKGIERSSSRFLVDVLADVSPSLEPLVLSGPSFASEVAQALPTAVTLAARSLDIARPVAKSMSLPTFRPYITDDLVGVQVGGAMKNVLAIAAGIVTGRGLGESARA